ncbi:helix-turn-helix domain-containing protein [Trinickia dinghuensis]|uniref:AraC family transcriptional regulator n=1 Tax=Trinickia dinghuensis TaxID=2291023 RepID=A0A3D8JXP0_9BURK|nr:AraC family transcriptional regulator [Trinickia dinghuensis]RDU97121.1 AraC family transcriptional regulator [Trinickia dinghuensis]
MDEPLFRDCAHYWRSPLVPGGDMVTAEYREHEFAPHWHEAYAVPVIEAGAEMFAYQGGHHVAEAGTVPVINPGEVHTGSRAMEVGWRYRVFYIPVDFMAELTGDIAAAPQPMPWFPADVIRDPDLAARVARAHRLLEGLNGSAHGGPFPLHGDPLAAETALIDAMSTLIVRHALRHTDARQPNIDPPRVALMKERLAADLTEPLSLSELAADVGLSAFHAARLFTQATRMPPHAWRNQLRLQRALAPLREGVAVADVAAACGFTDQSHFTRHFRRMFGVPPGRWQAGNGPGR